MKNDFCFTVCKYKNTCQKSNFEGSVFGRKPCRIESVVACVYCMSKMLGNIFEHIAQLVEEAIVECSKFRSKIFENFFAT